MASNSGEIWPNGPLQMRVPTEIIAPYLLRTFKFKKQSDRVLHTEVQITLKEIPSLHSACLLSILYRTIC